MSPLFSALSSVKSATIGKVLVAVASLAALAGVAGSQLAPSMPLAMVVLYSALGAASLLAVVLIAAVGCLTFWQFILRQGGTDAQWFWFSGEPQGLEQMRQWTAPAPAEPKP
ncbi:MAG: hypothetical protein RLZZ618_211 [Pseudomonadota bacterium]|jgi:hypothetical protein